MIPTCNRCNKTFRDNYGLTRHILRINICSIASKEKPEPLQNSLNVAPVSLEPVQEPLKPESKYQCIYCFKTFTTTWYKNNHDQKCKLKDDPIRLWEIQHKIDIKLPDNKLECRFCNNVFTRIDKLNLHINNNICKKRQDYLTKLQKLDKEKTEQIEKEEMEKSKKIEKEKQKSEKEKLKLERLKKIEKEEIKTSETIETNILYLIHEREFVNSNKPVYKLGRSKQEGFKRFKNYPKGSNVKMTIDCIDCVFGEKYLLNIFRKKYIQRSDIGNEYFEGPINDMREDLLNYTSNETTL
jgi:hypothetical protein